MYHPAIVAASVSALERSMRVTAREYSVEEVEDFVERLTSAATDKGEVTRPLAAEEYAFIQNELLMTRCSWDYWRKRYCYINTEGQALARMDPLMESQAFILRDIGKMEAAVWEEYKELGSADGILYDLLKARQIGGTTFSIAIQAHRTTTSNHVHGLIASDVPESSQGLMDKYELVLDNLPWFLRPGVTDKVKGAEVGFDGGSHVWIGAGKSTRGTTGKRGQLARSKTVSVVHLSELATWEDTDQIQSALMPAVPRSPRTLVQFESTASGRGNFWHKHWLAAGRGNNRHFQIFIPWFAESRKYALPAPPAWSPSQVTLEHAARCERDGPRWLRQPVKLSRDQLYWYERKRTEYESEGKLADFLAEYAADPDEAFQFSGRGVFSPLVIDRVSRQRKPLRGIFDVGPSLELQAGAAGARRA